MIPHCQTIGLLVSLAFVAELLAACGPKPVPPMVSEISAAPGTTILVGESASLTIRASGTDLQFRWTSSRGRLSSSTAPSVLYTAPDSPGPDTVTVKVIGRGGSTIQSITFQVVEPTLTPTATPTPTVTPTPTATPTPTLTPTLTLPPGSIYIDGRGWKVADWNHVEKATSITATGDGRLRGEFNGTEDPVEGDYKATFFTANLPTPDWTAYRSLKFDVENTLPPDESLEVTIAVATGRTSCWNQSTIWTSLGPGLNHLTFRLDTPDYNRCPNWDFGVIKERDYVRRLHLIFLLKEPLTGTVYIDNIWLEE